MKFNKIMILLSLLERKTKIVGKIKLSYGKLLPSWGQNLFYGK